MARPQGYQGWSVGAEGGDHPEGVLVRIPFQEGVPLVTLDLSRIVPASAVYSLRVTIPVAGERVQLPDVPCRSACIRALSGNAGDLYIGHERIDSTDGFPMAAGDTLDLAIDNLRRLYVDAANGGDGLAILVMR